MRRSRKTKKKINIKHITAILVIIALALIARSTAKYVLEKKDTHAQDSSVFYFESEIADIGEGKEYTLYWDGTSTKQIEFGIKNYIDKLQMTNQDIKYTIEAEITEGQDLATAKITNSSGTEIRQTDELILKESVLSDNKYKLCLQPNESIIDESEISIELTISSTEPYTKELNSTLKVIVKKDKEYELKYIENEDHTVINLRTHTLRNDIEIEYDNTKYVVDISNNIVKNSQIKTNGEKNTIKIPKNILEDNSNYEIILINKV